MLDQVKVPALGIYGDRDIIVHPKQWQPMQHGTAHAQVERFPLLGHFPMLEEPRVFAEKLKAFLDQDSAALARKTSPRAVPQKTSPSVTL